MTVGLSLGMRVAYVGPDASVSGRAILAGVRALDPFVRWGVCETWLAPSSETLVLLDDVGRLRVVHGEFAFEGERLSFRLELSPQLLFVVPDLKRLSLERAQSLLELSSRWSQCDIASLHHVDRHAAKSDIRSYADLAALASSARRYELLGPLSPGITSIASARVLNLADGAWSPSTGHHDAERSYEDFVRSGLAARCRSVNGRLDFESAQSWQPPPSTVQSPRDQQGEQQLARGIAVDPVDMEEVEVPAGLTSIGVEWTGWKPWFLHLDGWVARWSTLDDAYLLECHIEGADLTGASLGRVELNQTIVSRARLAMTDLSDATLRECSVSDTSFAGARLSGAVFDRAEFHGCDFAGIATEGLQIAGSRFVGCRLEEPLLRLAREQHAVVR